MNDSGRPIWKPPSPRSSSWPLAQGRFALLSKQQSAVGGAREVVTARGQRATVELRDGSQVTLGADSRLTIPADFGGTTRTVTLDGEAYFVVTPDARRPFDVRSGFAVTRVLGTRFGVLGRSDRDAVEVIVASGKVALRRMADTASRSC